jgi:hypothetical protein
VSDIPPERRSTHELYEQFRVAGARKARLDRQVRRRRRLQLIPGPVLGAILGFLVVGGGFAVGTKVFTGDDGTTLAGHDGGAQVRQAPGDRRLARASTADPSASGARWGLLTYQNTDGATCMVPGRLVGERVGRVEDGRFAAYDASPPGAMCGVPARAPLLLWTRSFATGDGARAVLYGIADRSVTTLRMTRGDTPVPIAPDGTFVVVAAGAQAFRGRALRVTRGGVTRDLPL